MLFLVRIITCYDMKNTLNLIIFASALWLLGGCVYYGFTFSPDKFRHSMPEPGDEITRNELLQILISDPDLTRISDYLIEMERREPFHIENKTYSEFLKDNPMIAYEQNIVSFQKPIKDIQPRFFDRFQNLKEGNIGNSEFYIFYDENFIYIGYVSRSIFHKSGKK